MMRPLFSDTVTVYHREGDAFVRYVLHGVQWRQKVERLNDNGRLSMVTVTGVTIPESVETVVGVGDVLILGEAAELTQEYTIAQLKKDYPTYCTVKSITDNTHRGRLKHRKVTAV